MILFEQPGMYGQFHFRAIAGNNPRFDEICDVTIIQSLKEILSQFSSQFHIAGGKHFLRVRTFLQENNAKARMRYLEQLSSLVAIRRNMEGRLLQEQLLQWQV